MTITKISENYTFFEYQVKEVDDNDKSNDNSPRPSFKIYVEKDLTKKTLTIQNEEGECDFSFINSKPETVKAIAEMLLRAAEL